MWCNRQVSRTSFQQYVQKHRKYKQHHGKKSNLVECQILPVESPTGVFTNFSFVESLIGVSSITISKSARFEFLLYHIKTMLPVTLFTQADAFSDIHLVNFSWILLGLFIQCIDKQNNLTQAFHTILL